mmetsp:Transcript_46652/g.104553  ORF Transcript_46652/g.104553 Transcript_46652/m.104553 type:complete len:189 (+) Transcript_46652:192-758(+)
MARIPPLIALAPAVLPFNSSWIAAVELSRASLWELRRVHPLPLQPQVHNNHTNQQLDNSDKMNPHMPCDSLRDQAHADRHDEVTGEDSSNMWAVTQIMKTYTPVGRLQQQQQTRRALSDAAYQQEHHWVEALQRSTETMKTLRKEQENLMQIKATNTPGGRRRGQQDATHPDEHPRRETARPARCHSS